MSRKRKMRKNKIAMLALCGILACGSAAGGAYALYSGVTDTTQNQFTIKAGKLNETDDTKVGVIEEDKWNQENAKNLAPNQSVDKNPKFISNSEYETWCIMKVTVPTEIMKIGGEDDAKVYDMVTLEDVDRTNWTLLKNRVSNTDDTDSEYYYGYNTALAKGDETTELFTSIKVPNISELETNVTDTVNITVYTIQKEGYATIQDAFAVLGVY